MKRMGRTAVYANSPDAMEAFDYSAPAEVFMTRAKQSRNPPISYRRFATAADAIRFAVEQPPAHLLGAVMEVSEQRFDHGAIRQLYDRLLVSPNGRAD
jgi:hypothetical protein